MFGLGMPEILLILAIALIVIGPKKLPELAKTLGRAMGEFKRSAQDFKRSIDIETTVNESVSPPPAEDLKDVIKDVNKNKDLSSDTEKEDNPASDDPDKTERSADKPAEETPANGTETEDTQQDDRGDAQFSSDAGTPAKE